MLKLLSKAFAVLALTAPLAAFADNPFSTYVDGEWLFGSTSSTSGAFSDSFSFVVGQPSDGLATILDISTPTSGITGLSYGLYDGSQLITGFSTTSSQPFGGGLAENTYTDWFSNLSPGTYTLDVSGTFKGGGGYGGFFGLSPAVPETSSWIAMAMGLGLMMFAAGKRRAS